MNDEMEFLNFTHFFFFSLFILVLVLEWMFLFTRIRCFYFLFRSYCSALQALVSLPLGNVYTLLLHGGDNENYLSFVRSRPPHLPFFDAIEYDILEPAYLRTRLKKNWAPLVTRLRQEIADRDASVSDGNKTTAIRELFECIQKNPVLYAV